MTKYTEEAEDFFTYAVSYLKKMDHEEQYWEWKHTKVTLKKFQEFVGADTIPFSDITTTKLEAFKVFLSQEYGKIKKTIKKQFKRLMRIIK